MNAWTRWKLAAKPASWPKLMVPFGLGQMIGVGAEGGFTRLGFALGALFTVFDLLYIVFLNDYADREVDALKRRMAPTTSPKTIPDGILPAHQVLFAGLASGAAALGISVVAASWLDRPALPLFALAALAIFGAYSLPPLRLNYRGGGEVLEMLGVALVLPLFQVYLQGGRIGGRGLWLLPGLCLLALASAVASGLADERSDRAGGKRTFVSSLGNGPGRWFVETFLVAGALAWALVGVVGPVPIWLGVAPALVVLFYTLRARRVSGAAQTDAFGAIGIYKKHVHDAIWTGTNVAAGALAYWHIIWGAR